MERPDLRALPLIKKSRSGFTRLWHDGTRQAKKDWLARWRGFSIWFLSTIWLVGLVASLGLMISFSISVPGFLNASVCQPDGNFASDPSNFQYWSSGFFQISLGFGHLTFTQAKAIDIIWDVAVGRGGQVVLAFVSWRVFAKYVATSMEVAPITFRTYRTIFLQNETSLLLAIPRMIRDFTFRHRLPSKIAMVYMVMTMVFVLIFPTWASAMTGYSGNVEARVAAADGNLVPFRSLHYAYFIIHDGWRIGKDADLIIMADMPNTYEPTKPNVHMEIAYAFGPGCHSALGWESCHLFQNLTQYAADFGLNGLNDTESTFMGTPLPSPVLNISLLFTPLDTSLSRGVLYPAPIGSQKPTWVYQNKLYNQTELDKAGRCQPLPKYQWGFSFMQLVLMLIVLILWSCGIFLMWLHAYIIMIKRGHRSVPGDYRALFELTEAIQNQLSDHGKEAAEDIRALPDSDIRLRINKGLRGGSIAYESTILSRSSFRKHIKQWVMKEKVWVIMFCVALGGMGGNASQLPNFAVILGVTSPMVVFTAVYVGTTNKSRTILLFWALLILGGVPQILYALLFIFFGT